MQEAICLGPDSGLIGAQQVPSLRIVIADDSPAVLENVVDMLREDFVVAAALPNGASVISQARGLDPDVVVLDISLGDMTGFDVARRLREMKCRARIVFLTVHESGDFVRAAVDLGATGYVFKSRASSDLINAIYAVSRGETFLPLDN
jgi:DNA-binding NarL/FixJ family response regulator